MEKEVKNWPQLQPENFLQWGNTKRLRCVKVHVKDGPRNGRVAASTISSRVVHRRNGTVVTSTTTAVQESPLLSSSTEQHQTYTSHRVLRNSYASPFGLRSLNYHSSSPEKGERQSHYQTRVGSGKVSTETTVMEKKVPNQQGRVNDGCSIGHGNHESIYDGQQTMAWPKFIISLSIKEKEEDFMAMKGSKLPQRPRKRSKFLQRTLNLVSPGSWLCELTQERYEVREKKTNKKRPRGLKAMVRGMDSDSD